MFLVLDWIIPIVCLFAMGVFGYAFVTTPNKWLRFLLVLGILIFLGFLIHGIGNLWGDYQTFR
jgi:hypothetical protein